MIIYLDTRHYVLNIAPSHIGTRNSRANPVSRFSTHLNTNKSNSRRLTLFNGNRFYYANIAADYRHYVQKTRHRSDTNHSRSHWFFRVSCLFDFIEKWRGDAIWFVPRSMDYLAPRWPPFASIYAHDESYSLRVDGFLATKLTRGTTSGIRNSTLFRNLPIQ